MSIWRSGSAASVPWWLRISVVSIVVLGVFFRFYHIDRKVFWEDEIIGTMHAFGYTEAEIVAASPHLTRVSDVRRYLKPAPSSSLMSTVTSLAAEDAQHPPPYYLINALWADRFGASVEALRTPAAIFGVLALVCVFWLALELFGSLATAYLAVMLVAVSPLFVLYSQEAREYSMWTAAIALDAIVFLRAIRTGSLAAWIAYGVSTAAALYIFPLSGFVALGFAAYLLIKERGRLTRPMLLCVAANLAALALFAPWLKEMMTSAGWRGLSKIVSSKMPVAQVADVFVRDIRFLFFDIGPARVGPLGHTVLNAGFTLIVVALCTGAIAALIRGTRFSIWGFVVIGLCLPMTPLLLDDLLIRGNFVYQTRYFFPMFLGLELAVAALFGRLLLDTAKSRAVRMGFGVLLSIVLGGELLSCAVSSAATTWWNKDGERAPAVAAIVNDARKPLVVSDYVTPSILELSLYLNPAVPVRLDLQCAICRSSPPAGPTFSTRGYGTVFAVESVDRDRSSRYRWINPNPFPNEAYTLNMFTVSSHPV